MERRLVIYIITGVAWYRMVTTPPHTVTVVSFEKMLGIVFQAKKLIYHILPRECPLNGLFHDLVPVILTSQMVVSEVEIPNRKSRHPFMVRDCLPQPLVVVKITTANKLL